MAFGKIKIIDKKPLSIQIFHRQAFTYVLTSLNHNVSVVDSNVGCCMLAIKFIKLRVQKNKNKRISRHIFERVIL